MGVSRSVPWQPLALPGHEQQESASHDRRHAGPDRDIDRFLVLQRQLERFYGLERAPSVAKFLILGAARSYEQVLVRQAKEELYVAVVFPEDQIPMTPMQPSDSWTQLIEGVSHFLFLAERARVELPTTQLELELQAEVDKFVILMSTTDLSEAQLNDLRDRLYDNVRFLHPSESEEGARYRLANQLAARLVSRVYRSGRLMDWQKSLRAFYRAGQTEKLSIAQAA